MEENNEYYEEEQSSFSLIKIFKVLLKGWKAGIIALISSGLLVTIALLFILNPIEQVYTVEFDYAQIPGIGSGSGYYVDGSIFNYKSIIDSESVNTVLVANQQLFQDGKTNYNYSNIDLKKLYSKDFSIDINKVYYDKITDSTEEVPQLKEITYVITMPKKAFKSDAYAKEFVTDLIELPLNKTIEMVNNLTYTSNLVAYTKASTYSEKLNYLNSQYSLINVGYNNINESLGGALYIIDGITYDVKSIMINLDSYLSSVNHSTMSTELRQLGYYNKESKELYKSSLLYKLDDIEKENEYLNKKLTSINETFNTVTKSLENITSSTDVVTTEQIMALLTQVSTQYTSDINSLKSQILANQEEERQLRIKINAVNNTKSVTDPGTGEISYVAKTTEEITEFDANNKLFGERLDAIYDRLVEETKTYTLISNSIKLKNMTIFYRRADIVAVEGGYSLTKVGLVAVVGGLVVGLAVAGIVGAVKTYKNPEKKEEEITA